MAGSISRILPEPILKSLYRIPPLARFLRVMLNRASPSGMTTVKVAAGLLEGYSLNLDMQAEKDYWLGTYEMDLQSVLPQLVTPGMVTYDVGANIGYISLMLAHLSGESGKVFAFEALPSNGIRWMENMELNSFSSRTQLFKGAVTERKGTINFLVHESGGMGKVEGSAGRDDQYMEEIQVPTISLDDFVHDLNNPPPELIKLDIEGGEILALPGMKQVLSKYKPILLMELHGKESIQVGWEILTSLDYSICKMKPDFPMVSNISELDWKSYLVALPGNSN